MARHAGLLLWPASPGAVPTIAALAPTGWGQMGVPWGQTVLTAWADTIDDSLFPGGACGGSAAHPALLRDGTRRVLSLERCGLNRHRAPGGRGQDVEIRRPARGAAVATPRSLMTMPPAGVPGASHLSAHGLSAETLPAQTSERHRKPLPSRTRPRISSGASRRFAPALSSGNGRAAPGVATGLPPRNRCG